MSRKASWAALLIKAVCAAIIFFSTVFTIYTVGPHIETRYFPVVSKLHIEHMTTDGEGNTIIHASFRKIRECEYVGIAWFKGSREETFERLPIILLRQEGDTSSPNRPVGFQKAGPWIIQGVTPDQLRGNSFAELRHECHPFWTTTTWFWP